MQRFVKALTATTFATAAVIAASPTAASAAPPAPQCSSAAGQFSCSSASTGRTTWTLTFYYATAGPITVQWFTPGPTVQSSCYNYGLPIVVRYAFDSSGQSPSVAVYCTP